MRTSRVQWWAVIAATLAAAAFFGHGHAIEAWMRVNGTVVPNSTGTFSFGGKPVHLVSVLGDQSPTARPGASMYHVLVIVPADSVTPTAFVTGPTPFSITTPDELTAWSGPAGNAAARTVSVDSRYNALLDRVTIHGHRYSLARGNLVVVRFSDGGGPTSSSCRDASRTATWTPS